MLDALKVMFKTEQTLPPGVSIRCLWRAETPEGTTDSSGKPVSRRLDFLQVRHEDVLF